MEPGKGENKMGCICSDFMTGSKIILQDVLEVIRMNALEMEMSLIPAKWRDILLTELQLWAFVGDGLIYQWHRVFWGGSMIHCCGVLLCTTENVVKLRPWFERLYALGSMSWLIWGHTLLKCQVKRCKWVVFQKAVDRFKKYFVEADLKVASMRHLLISSDHKENNK